MLRNKKSSKIKLKFLFLGAVFFLISSIIFIKVEGASGLTIGFVSDIHAGDQSYREEDATNIIYPNHFEKNFKKALSGMRDADIIFTLGDNLNRPSRKNANKLMELSKNYPVYWVRGNHDKLNHFQKIFSKERYHYVDKKNWRIIALDNSEVYPDPGYHEEFGRGYIDNEQLIWLKEALKTENNIIIATHLPILSHDNLNNIREDHQELEDLFVKNGKVKHIFSGHYHLPYTEISKNGIIHHLVPPLSLKDGEGFYYKIEL